MKKNYIALLLILLIGINSCDKCDMKSTDCSECYTIKPDTGELIIKLTINDENPKVPIVIYKNNIEDNDIEFTDTARSEDYYIDVPINKYYSVTARYKVNDKTIVAVDGDKIKTKKIYSCDELCWIIKGGYINVKLKYN